MLKVDGATIQNGKLSVEDNDNHVFVNVTFINSEINCIGSFKHPMFIGCLFRGCRMTMEDGNAMSGCIIDPTPALKVDNDEPDGE